MDFGRVLLIANVTFGAPVLFFVVAVATECIVGNSIVRHTTASDVKVRAGSRACFEPSILMLQRVVE